MPDLQPPQPSEEAIALWRKRRAERAVKPSAKPQNLKQLAATLRKNADDNITRLEGTLLRTAGAGGKCLARLLKPWKGLKQLPAIAIDGCTAHKRVVLFRGKDGDWFALGKGNERLWTQREQARRGRYVNPLAGSIQYVLRKTVSGTTSYYVCGARQECTKVLDLPSGAVVVDFALNNLDQNQNRFLFSIYYRLTTGQYVFQLYSEDQLEREYSEAGLAPYFYNFGVNSGNFTSAASAFMAETYGNRFFYAVGFGRFAANFCRDANTVDNPLSVAQPGTATTTGNIRMLIDLRSSSQQKTTLPPQSASRSFSPYTASDRWLDIPVFGSLKDLSVSFLTGDTSLNLQGEVVSSNSNADMRYLLAASDSGEVGISETVIEALTADATSDVEDDYVIVNRSGQETRHLARGSGGLTQNRFVIGFSTETSLARKRFYDLAEDGLFLVENAQPNPAAQPAPIPSESLYQIERSLDPKQVTVQLLNLDFSAEGSIVVNVFPPDINEGETSNFGTVVAASYYAPGTT